LPNIASAGRDANASVSSARIDASARRPVGPNLVRSAAQKRITNAQQR